MLLFSVLCAFADSASNPSDNSSKICRITFSADGPVDAAALESRLLIKSGDLLEAKGLRKSIENLY
jgi:hypothetical protein